MTCPNHHEIGRLVILHSCTVCDCDYCQGWRENPDQMRKASILFADSLRTVTDRPEGGGK